MTQLKDAVVVLTGAAGGFGREFTRQLLQAGSRLILTDIDEKLLRDRITEIRQEIASGEIIAYWNIDLASSAGCETLYTRIKSLNLPVDILINNAGLGLFGRMDEVPVAKWERLMEINLISPMRLSSLFIADAIARRQGHIVNISSMAGWVAPAGMAHYSTSKFGLRGFSEGLYNEVKAYNVKVTAVYPFFSRTPILQSEGYGTLAGNKEINDRLISDPARVIKNTIRAIEKDRLHVFPDRIGKSIHLLKQYFPSLLDWLGARGTRNK
ncbi:SDR family oxidoreductase [Myxosarcina sp. GI1]|uniref:SDR family NAD(P)-dependent oxidoreductase n=1 Tax=Myxosarcina sp. GI1 TaxID=1541065 RepID=UPI000565FE1B|nr:SDR family NAD(P)-dependent oxidoreductase [Myxosarcina sp. GI1]